LGDSTARERLRLYDRWLYEAVQQSCQPTVGVEFTEPYDAALIHHHDLWHGSISREEMPYVGRPPGYALLSFIVLQAIYRDRECDRRVGLVYIREEVVDPLLDIIPYVAQILAIERRGQQHTYSLLGVAL
jgi:hypothetical protein